jgi:hypothetical protein
MQVNLYTRELHYNILTSLLQDTLKKYRLSRSVSNEAEQCKAGHLGRLNDQLCSTDLSGLTAEKRKTELVGIIQCSGRDHSVQQQKFNNNMGVLSIQDQGTGRSGKQQQMSQPI